MVISRGIPTETGSSVTENLAVPFGAEPAIYRRVQRLSAREFEPQELAQTLKQLAEHHHRLFDQISLCE